MLTAGKSFQHPTHRPNELWQTDFTYLHVVSWGWYYLSTVLDDYSRYILAWTLRTSMAATDVMDTLDLARAAAGVDRVPVVHRATAAQRQRALRHLRAARDVSRHARAAAHAERAVSSDDAGQDRYHRSLKNVVKLDHYYTPWALKRAIARFVEDYNHRRYHESLQNVTPADVYEGRQAAILARRERIKQQPLQRRKRENLHTPHHAAMRSDVPLSNGTQLCHRV